MERWTIDEVFASLIGPEHMGRVLYSLAGEDAYRLSPITGVFHTPEAAIVTTADGQQHVFMKGEDVARIYQHHMS